MTNASATGVPSENEDLTIDACRTFVRRQNHDGATWDEPVEVDQRTGAGVDAESRDTHDPSRLLQMSVTRADVDEEFWKRLHRDEVSTIPPGAVEDVACRIWTAIERKRLQAHRDVVLLLNAIRTAWLAQPPIVEAFRRRFGNRTRDIGFETVWIVGADETFTERLDT